MTFHRWINTTCMPWLLGAMLIAAAAGTGEANSSNAYSAPAGSNNANANANANANTNTNANANANANANEADAGAQASARQLWISAIGNDRASTLRQLLAEHRSELVQISSANGKTALMVACKSGDFPLARQLVMAGADVHAQTLTGGTPLMFAVLGNHLSIAQWLAAQGANIDIRGSNGWSAVTIAAAKGLDEILLWLLEQGGNAEAVDVYRFTPLMRAVDNGHVATAEILLAQADAAVNVRDEYDNTPLHHAVSAANKSMVTLLLEHKADSALRNRDGQTALQLALELFASAETEQQRELARTLAEQLRE